LAGLFFFPPPLHRAKDSDLVKWIGSNRKLVAIIPEHDEYLAPKEAVVRFSVVPEAEVIAVDGAKHLLVGELATRTVLNEIVKIVAPGSYPLPEQF